MSSKLFNGILSAHAAAQHVLAQHAQGIAARSDETLQAAQPEGQEPGGEAMRPSTVTVSTAEILAKALEPFAAIQPSSFYPSDGSECEGYAILVESCCEPEFTGADLANARSALSTYRNQGGDK